MLLWPLKHLFHFAKGDKKQCRSQCSWCWSVFMLVIYGCIWAKSACFIFQWMCMHEPDHSWLPQTVAPSLTSVRKVLPSAPQPIPHPQPPTGSSAQRSSFLVGDIRYWRGHWFQGSVSSRPDCNFPDSSHQHNTGHITHSLWQHFL